MGHHNINISNELYAFLASLKLPGESFTSLLWRLTKGERTKGIDFSKYHGKLKEIPDQEWNKIDKELKSMWKTWKTP